ncbi:caspase family protein [Streptomyces capillispiralis]|uniref:caspase, EACC1-associated type n=1 Tax=Streptomyces capillispiralis TaxID=68182 RepID=UPI0036B14A93
MSAGRYALLVATGTYDDRALSRLRSPARDAHALAEVLGDPRIGDFEVSTVVDGRHREVTRAIERFFLDRRRDDLLLLHLSCHGLKNDRGELHFAAADTDRRLLASTSVPAPFVRRQMNACRARSVVLLLDCCYSGAFLAGSKGDTTVHVHDELAGHGRAVLTATNRTEYAWEGERITALDPEPSRFTGAVVRGLRSGEADGNRDGLIDVHELYDYVYEELHSAGAEQRPQMWAELEHRVVVARSVLRPLPPVRRESGGPPVRRRGEPPVRESGGPPVRGGGEPPVREDVGHPARPTRPPVPPPTAVLPPVAGRSVSALAPLALLTRAMTGLTCMADAESRRRFAAVLGDRVGRPVDLRGVRQREDVVALVRAGLDQDDGPVGLIMTIAVFEGEETAHRVWRTLDPDDGPPVRRRFVDPGPDSAARGPWLLLRLTEAMCALSCMRDPQERLLFASVLGEELGRRIELRGTRMREDVVALVRAALQVPQGEEALVLAVRILEGDPAAEDIARLIDGTGRPP